MLTYFSLTHSLTYLLTVYLRLTYSLSSWPLDPPLANVLRMGWAETHTERPPFAAILEKVTAHHQQACVQYTLHFCIGIRATEMYMHAYTSEMHGMCTAHASSRKVPTPSRASSE